MDKDVSADEAVDLMLQSANLATHYEYDALDRTVTEIQAPVTLPDGTACLPTSSYYYDANGNMTSMVDARRNSREYLTEPSIDSGLVGYLKLDDGSGLTATSGAPDLPNGTIVNTSDTTGMPQWVDGLYGGALSFSEGGLGVGENHAALQVPNLEVNTDADSHNTVSFWMKWDGSDNDQPIVFSGGQSLAFNNNGQIGFNTGDGGLMLTPAGLDMANRWVHITAVFVNAEPTSTNCKIYVDGVNQTLSTNGGDFTDKHVTQTMIIGGPTNSQVYNRYVGLLDDVRVYNRELNVDEVQALLDTEKSTYWKYDALGRVVEEVQSTVVDAEGNAIQPTTRYRYDEYGNLDAVADPSCSLGQWSTLYEYDNRGRVA